MGFRTDSHGRPREAKCSADLQASAASANERPDPVTARPNTGCRRPAGATGSVRPRAGRSTTWGSPMPSPSPSSNYLGPRSLDRDAATAIEGS